MQRSASGRIAAPGVSYECAYREVDGALYIAKREGKGRCHFCMLR